MARGSAYVDIAFGAVEIFDRLEILGHTARE